MVRTLLGRTALLAAVFLAGCSVTTVTFDRQGETPLALVKAPARNLPIYTAATLPSADYAVIGTVRALRGMEQLRGLTGPVREAEVLALLKKKAAAEGAHALLDVQVKERHVSLKLGDAEIPPQVLALAEYGCDIIHYVEATAKAIVFTSALQPR